MKKSCDEGQKLDIALAGNPNVGKSTVFNCLTGLKQHTGNWAGKTVSNAKGIWKIKDEESQINVNLMDLPGCYTIEGGSPEEEIAGDYIKGGDYDGIIVICDGTCLERNLILVYQILACGKKTAVCINLMDSVRKQGISIDEVKLAEILKVPVISTKSTDKKEMKRKFNELLLSGWPEKGTISNNDKTADAVELAETTAAMTVRKGCKEQNTLTMTIDRIMTNPLTGFPVIGLLLMLIFWITLKGANYPSALLGEWLFSLEKPLKNLLFEMGLSTQICLALSEGMYRVLAWVVSVMLPPMAIFFPMFTLLEDWGLLPRIAFNLDRCFKGCKACGKQALTMCMGLGCNASAIVGCRIINSKRERLLAMLTNSLIPCNGRFPILIAVIAMFFSGHSSMEGALILGLVIAFGVAATIALTALLSKTVLRGVPGSFTLELPPYRKPEIGRVIVRSIFDRTLFVLGRAVVVAAPAGLLIWIIANYPAGGISYMESAASFLEPAGKFVGLDGIILVAFILGLPANEIVLPIIMMVYMGQNSLAELSGTESLRSLLVDNGWDTGTAVCMLIFTLMHWPCATTLITIYKESGGIKWVILSALAPLIMGIIVCCVVNSVLF